MDTPSPRIVGHPMVASSVIYFMEVMHRTDNSVAAAMALIAATMAFHLLRRFAPGGRYGTTATEANISSHSG
jgi:hypothetical protein